MRLASLCATLVFRNQTSDQHRFAYVRISLRDAPGTSRIHPIRGSIGTLWGKIRQTMSAIVFVFVVFVFEVAGAFLVFVSGLLFAQNCQLKLGDGFQYLFNDFGTPKMFIKYGPWGPLICFRNTPTLFEIREQFSTRIILIHL